MTYSHCMGMGPGQVQGTGPVPLGNNGYWFLALSHRQLITFLYNILGAIALSPVACTCPSPFLCSVKKPQNGNVSNLE